MPDPDVYIYLDEFERENTFALTAIFIPVDIAAQLLAEWDALRKDIKTVLLSDYPLARNSPKLQGNKLPEIHAVELFQSQNYYRKYAPGNEIKGDEYWKQHYEWLDRALRIIHSYKIQSVVGGWTGEDFKQASDERFTFWDNFLSDPGSGLTNINPRYSRAKLRHLLHNKYLLGLPKIISDIEAYLQANNLFGELICDDHEMSKGFSLTTCFDWLQAEERYKHLTKPKFASGLDEALLQVCDVICYVAGRRRHMQETNLSPEKDSDILLNYWFYNYVNGSFVEGIGDNSERAGYWYLIPIELALELAVQDAQTVEELRQILRLMYKA